MSEYIKTLKSISKKISDEEWISDLPILYQFLLNVAIGAAILGLIFLFVYLMVKFWIVIAFILAAATAGVIFRKLISKR